jgi:hypothetical protein
MMDAMVLSFVAALRGVCGRPLYLSGGGDR